MASPINGFKRSYNDLNRAVVWVLRYVLSDVRYQTIIALFWLVAVEVIGCVPPAYRLSVAVFVAGDALNAIAWRRVQSPGRQQLCFTPYAGVVLGLSTVHSLWCEMFMLYR